MYPPAYPKIYPYTNGHLSLSTINSYIFPTSGIFQMAMFTDIHTLNDGSANDIARTATWNWLAQQINSWGYHMVLYTGDFIDGETGSTAVDMGQIIKVRDLWNQIYAPIRAVALGNREHYNSELSNYQIAATLGYLNNPITATSQFNSVFIAGTKAVKILFFVLDYFDLSFISPTVQNWIQNILYSNYGSYDCAVCASHSSDFFTYFDTAVFNANALLTAAQITKNNNISITQTPMYYLHGHNHGNQGLAYWDGSQGAPVDPTTAHSNNITILELGAAFITPRYERIFFGAGGAMTHEAVVKGS